MLPQNQQLGSANVLQFGFIFPCPISPSSLLKPTASVFRHGSMHDNASVPGAVVSSVAQAAPRLEKSLVLCPGRSQFFCGFRALKSTLKFSSFRFSRTVSGTFAVLKYRHSANDNEVRTRRVDPAEIFENLTQNSAAFDRLDSLIQSEDFEDLDRPLDRPHSYNQSIQDWQDGTPIPVEIRVEGSRPRETLSVDPGTTVEELMGVLGTYKGWSWLKFFPMKELRFRKERGVYSRSDKDLVSPKEPVGAIFRTKGFCTNALTLEFVHPEDEATIHVLFGQSAFAVIKRVSLECDMRRLIMGILDLPELQPIREKRPENIRIAAMSRLGKWKDLSVDSTVWDIVPRNSHEGVIQLQYDFSAFASASPWTLHVRFQGGPYVAVPEIAQSWNVYELKDHLAAVGVVPEDMDPMALPYLRVIRDRPAPEPLWSEDPRGSDSDLGSGGSGAGEEYVGEEEILAMARGEADFGSPVVAPASGSRNNLRDFGASPPTSRLSALSNKKKLEETGTCVDEMFSVGQMLCDGDHLTLTYDKTRKWDPKAPVVLSEPSNHICHVDDNLFLGSKEGASNSVLLFSLGVSSILTAATEIKLPYKQGMFRFLRLNVTDYPAENIQEHFNDSHRFIHEALQAGQGVLVHCAFGASRSATIVISYLMRTKGWTVRQALTFLKSRRPIVSPNPGFMSQLKKYEATLVRHGIIVRDGPASTLSNNPPTST